VTGKVAKRSICWTVVSTVCDVYVLQVHASCLYVAYSSVMSCMWLYVYTAYSCAQKQTCTSLLLLLRVHEDGLQHMRGYYVRVSPFVMLKPFLDWVDELGQPVSKRLAENHPVFDGFL
jgi:hypothetical protein